MVVVEGRGGVLVGGGGLGGLDQHGNTRFQSDVLASIRSS